MMTTLLSWLILFLPLGTTVTIWVEGSILLKFHLHLKNVSSMSTSFADQGT
ncbi:hypothetical protein Syun_029907 [Stephania yunnanensis]|uniref:Uncharacterized protein n=1 Tax=Stephania yunnanensis TaxID=152371 RepID=A0AAP0E9H4_9MAGN